MDAEFWVVEPEVYQRLLIWLITAFEPRINYLNPVGWLLLRHDKGFAVVRVFDRE
jgi:hypothetical protein